MNGSSTQSAAYGILLGICNTPFVTSVVGAMAIERDETEGQIILYAD